jgi:outer membrane receptor protein involved in Fe transport
LDLSVRYQFNKWLFATLDINLSKARYIQAAKGNDYLPLAVPLSSVGGLECKLRNGINGGISYRYLKDRPANQDNTLVAKGYFVCDLTANYSKKKYETGFEIQNLLNTEWREAQFEAHSRLRTESHPIDGINFTPGTLFFVKLKFALFF